MGVIVIEGPDRCGKTTMAMAMAEETGREFRFLPSPIIRPLVFSGELNNPFIFFADAKNFWETHGNSNIILDRDILSMLAYQSYLLNKVDPQDVVDWYRKYVYNTYAPEKIIYVTNEPFAPYDENDPFEKHGYEKIRDCYERAVSYLNHVYHEIEVERYEVPTLGVH